MIEALGHGKIPSIPAEMGARAEWRHNKQGLATKLAVVAGISLAAAVLLRGRRPRGTPAPVERKRITLSENETALGEALRDAPAEDAHWRAA